MHCVRGILVLVESLQPLLRQRVVVQVEDGRAIFHMACLSGTAEMVSVLVGVDRLDVHAVDVRAVSLLTTRTCVHHHCHNCVTTVSMLSPMLAPSGKACQASSTSRRMNPRARTSCAYWLTTRDGCLSGTLSVAGL